MLPSVLIANRGEIACRIARTAKRLGMRTIAVYSEADQGALHTRLCDEAHVLGASSPRDSYLAIDKLIAIAREARAACIHPGYGFLSENAAFAEACARAGIVFIGPPPDAIRAMGLKDRAKALMDKSGVPIVPGYHGDRQEASFLRQKAYEIGYPLALKAVAGGGGRGLRRVDKHAEFEQSLASARREALAAFGDDRMLLERYVTSPRHIEIQVFADQHGHVIHLNERDCSLQRRHQKVIEEAPAPGMSADLRAAMGAAAVEAARAVGYVGAGTVEFIAESPLRIDRFWFMEMNTRLQVEHGVTEAISDVDLVEWQFRIAAGEPLPRQQKQVRIDGHAVEARLYAEDPEHGFLPSTGKILALELPSGPGIRVDTGVEIGSEVTSFYDAMIAKVIVHASTREAALDQLAAALERTVVMGPRCNAAFLGKLVRAPEFRTGTFDTGLIDRNPAAFGAVAKPIDAGAAALGAARLITLEQARLHRLAADDEAQPSPWDAVDGFQLAGPRIAPMPVMVDGESVTAEVGFGAAGVNVTINGVAAASDARMVAAGDTVYLLRGGRQTTVALKDFATIDVAHANSSGTVIAPMHGKMLEVLVAPGAAVRRGQRLAVLEAMKMEQAVLAPCDGVVVSVAVTVGQQIAEKAVIAVLDPAGKI
jgi:3-methylcrotonyl-CoA carboxylase alpha subunit